MRVMIYGVWDLTHYGHYEKFRILKDMGYDVFVGVVSDEFTASYKRKPIMSEQERFANIAACKWVDEVFISQSTPSIKVFESEIIDKRIDVIAHGSDWTRAEYCAHMGLDSNDYTWEFITLPYTKGVSTTQLIERVKEK